MPEFPRTMVEDLSLPRMLIGTNWFLGFSHQSPSRDKLISDRSVSQIADVLAVFLEHGIDAIVGFIANDRMYEAVQDAQQRTGRKMIIISTPGIDVNESPEADAKNAEIFDLEAKRGSSLVMPHTSSTDTMLDKRARVIRGMDKICAMIRERDMIPGLSTHEPESIVFADETKLDVGTYISIYNAAGFMMPIEIDWVNHIIRNAKNPVITIKPFAAGRLHPFVGLAFSWATLRPQDMITVGTMTPDEAKELIEISYSLFENRQANVELQVTRSKQTLVKQD
ncbi:hypothetical protein LCGC14_0226120 [marine sediment metagenome]|uniref:NADP-dependent oxidoreductase domain-containing protein n=1 Tax=marine sediment metagenome TaxID=412755 RepID=A0A0F9UG70_9ZZZZ|nr:hypothetical protein [Phycisphaerae bacterium]HDZ42935.1 hypothetical protein [Phycisphaerae bacterium]